VSTSTYTIGEAAERRGFTASALRYYDGIGLLGPTSRTGASYRVYDDRALSRLAFIAPAKQLGCSLEEIADLAAVWDGNQCAPVQRRIHELVTEKVQSTQRQLAELAAFAAELQQAATYLSGPASDGPCGDDCACLGTSASEPIACTLEPAAMPGRVLDWQRILEHAGERTPLADGGLRLEFDHEIDITELARLIVAEQGCCSFFSFAITVDTRGTALEVRTPDAAADIVAAVFGRPAA
jgi:DNA-binding transcriptional MerR regulator